MKKRILFLTYLVLVYCVCFSQEWKIEKTFFIPSGNGRGQIGPAIKDMTVPGRGDTDQPWGVSGLGIDGSGNLTLLDNMNMKMLVFSSSGKLIEEIQGIGGIFDNGYSYGTINELGDSFLIHNKYSLSVFDKRTTQLLSYLNIRSYGASYRRITYYAIINKTAFYWNRCILWCIPDIFDSNSRPVELRAGHEILKKVGIEEINGTYYLPKGELLFRDFSIYQPIYIPGDVNKGEEGEFLGSWNGINVWVNNKTDVILGPIGKSTQMKRVVDEKYLGTPANIFFTLSSDGYVYFTGFSKNEGGITVNRLDLRSFFEEKKRVEKKN